MRAIHNVRQIVEGRLCLGCGACAYICPEKRIRLVDALPEGIRPVVETDQCATCTDCLKVCPSYENDHTQINRREGVSRDLVDFCGPVLEIWEGHATDDEIRFMGSSGGVISAISLYCLEQQEMEGVLHIAMDPEDALRNRTTFSRTRAALLAATGSRYAPASACDRLEQIEKAGGKCVFVGQPSEVTALRKAQALRPALDGKVGLAISFFCAGSPATQGTIDLLKKLGLKPEEVQDLRYRGRGWPGLFSATLKGQTEPARQMTYQESWGFVEAYRPFSTHLCPDGTGEDADLSCGDPWYQEPKGNELGSSLVVVRTETGRRVLRAAMNAGYLSLRPAEAWKLLGSQANLISKRGAIGGRIAAMKALGLPVPKLRGFSLFRNWRRLNLSHKVRSTLGTVRRVVTRRYHRPLLVKVEGRDQGQPSSVTSLS